MYHGDSARTRQIECAATYLILVEMVIYADICRDI